LILIIDTSQILLEGKEKNTIFQINQMFFDMRLKKVMKLKAKLIWKQSKILNIFNF